MNKDNAKDYLPLVQALAYGEVIQLKDEDGKWVDVSEVSFSFDVGEYRIKREPKEIWVNRYSDGSESGHYSTEEAARIGSGGNKGVIQVRYREVIE